MKPINYILFASVFFFFVGGCALKNKKVDETVQNPNIIYRDLTKPIDVQSEKIEISCAQNIHTPDYFIEFENESITQFDSPALEKFISQTDMNQNIIIFGHSHGNSSKGTLTLSSGRAQKIRDVLVQRGYQNVFVMAFWGQGDVSFAPTKGVQLYVIQTENFTEVALTLKKNEGAKNEEIDPSKSIGGGNYNSGNVAGIFRPL